MLDSLRPEVSAEQWDDGKTEHPTDASQNSMGTATVSETITTVSADKMLQINRVVDTDIAKENHVDNPTDGGWGWFVVLGSAIAHFVIGGLERGGGVIYLELLDKFEDSASATSWVASLGSGLRLILGPVASALCNRFNVRKVVLVGAIIYAAACISTAFAPALFVVHLSFGVIGGFGLALCYTPCVVIVGMYFDKRRSLVVGLATAGSGVGTFCLPPLTEYLFNAYGFKGSFILIGGIVLHMAICGMLFRPLDFHWKLNRKQIYGLKKTRGLPGYEKEYDALLGKTVPSSNTIVSAQDRSIELETSITKNCPEEMKLDMVPTCTSVPSAGEKATNLRADQTEQRKHGSNSLVRTTKFEFETKQDHEEESSAKVTLSSTGEMELGLNSIVDMPKETKTVSGKKKVLDIQLLKDPLFLCFCFALGLFTSAYIISVVFLPALGESKGLSKMEAALLVSVTGISDTVGRLTSGVVFDRERIRPHRRYVYNLSLILIGIVTLIYPFIKSFVGFILICVAYGLLTGTYKGQISVIVVDMLGKEKLVSSFGIAVWFQGIGSLIGPPIAGKLRDSFGNYDVAFYLGGLMTLLAGSMLMFSNIYYYCKHRQTKSIATCTT